MLILLSFQFPRTHDALPEKFRTPSQRKTVISTFTNIVEGEAAELAQDFQRFLFASNIIEILCQGVGDISNLRWGANLIHIIRKFQLELT